MSLPSTFLLCQVKFKGTEPTTIELEPITAIGGDVDSANASP
jgi:hypothetical protein